MGSLTHFLGLMRWRCLWAILQLFFCYFVWVVCRCLLFFVRVLFPLLGTVKSVSAWLQLLRTVLTLLIGHKVIIVLYCPTVSLWWVSYFHFIDSGLVVDLLIYFKAFCPVNFYRCLFMHMCVFVYMLFPSLVNQYCLYSLVVKEMKMILTVTCLFLLFYVT